MAPVKGTEFGERVDFPSDWLVGDEHGIEHDGLERRAVLELKLKWRAGGKERTATLRVAPWLSYGCSEGARLSIRHVGAAEVSGGGPNPRALAARRRGWLACPRRR